MLCIESKGTRLEENNQRQADYCNVLLVLSPTKCHCITIFLPLYFIPPITAELDSEHAQKVPEAESGQQQVKLKDRQKFFEEAFQQDMEHYLSTSYLQITERRGEKKSPLTNSHFGVLCCRCAVQGPNISVHHTMFISPLNEKQVQNYYKKL